MSKGSDYYWRNKEKLNAKSRAYYRAHRDDQIEQAKKRNKVRLYGVTDAAYRDMVEAQDGTCAICGSKPETLVIDHDHETHEVRALLCANCNAGIGLLKDDPEVLAKAAQYVYSHRSLVRLADSTYVAGVAA